jgi:hypothetical protein
MSGKRTESDFSSLANNHPAHTAALSVKPIGQERLAFPGLKRSRNLDASVKQSPRHLSEKNCVFLRRSAVHALFY